MSVEIEGIEIKGNGTFTLTTDQGYYLCIGQENGVLEVCNWSHPDGVQVQRCFAEKDGTWRIEPND